MYLKDMTLTALYFCNIEYFFYIKTVCSLNEYKLPLSQLSLFHALPSLKRNKQFYLERLFEYCNRSENLDWSFYTVLFIAPWETSRLNLPLLFYHFYQFTNLITILKCYLAAIFYMLNFIWTHNTTDFFFFRNTRIYYDFILIFDAF